MNSARSSRQGFTLVEMLVVIGIIAILAALLLPVLVASKQRAKRIVCESRLRQIGIAFQSFAHDHNNKFPMQVSTNDSGSLEFVQGGYQTNGLFYFAFRHFQPLGGVLDTPKMLVCPADTRLPATNFTTLQNSNISYFVGVTAEYTQPMSILSGDGNLASSSTLVRGGAGKRLTWNRDLHQFKGNVLFADGHVEEWSDSGTSVLTRGDFVLPSLRGGQGGSQDSAQSSAPSAAGSSFSTNDESASDAATTNRPSHMPTNPPVPLPANSASSHNARTVVSEPSRSDVTTPVVENPVRATNSPGRVSSPSADDSMMSPFDRQLAHFLRLIIFGTYSLILLLLLLFAAYRIWRYFSDPERQRRRRRSARMED